MWGIHFDAGYGSLKENTMKRLFCLVMLGLLGAGTLAGCEASAKVGDDTDSGHGSYNKTTVKRESPSGDTTYERKTETKTEIH